MGLLTTLIWRYGARFASVVLSSPELASESERQIKLSSGNLMASEDEERRHEKFVKGLYVTSALADLFDFLNSALDLVFAATLVQLKDSTVFAVILITGVVLGRATIIRGSYLLFKNGILWKPFWIGNQPSDSRALRLLHTLFFTETAVFLFEDFPCLVIYSHWSTINFPPVPLRTVDDVNVVFTVASLLIVTILMLVSIISALMHLDWNHWTGSETIINSCKVITVFVLCGLLMRFVLLSLQEAFSFTLLKDKQLPSNKLLGIPICDEQTQETRAEYCDEKSFLVRVILAWLAAACLCFFLFFRAAPAEEDSTLPVITSTTKLGALTASTGGKDTKGAPNQDGTSSTHLDASMNKHDHDDDGDDDDDDENGDGDESNSSIGEDSDDEKKGTNQSVNKRSSYHRAQL